MDALSRAGYGPGIDHMANAALTKIKRCPIADARTEIERCDGYVISKRYQEIQSWWFEDGSRIWRSGHYETKPFQTCPPDRDSAGWEKRWNELQAAIRERDRLITDQTLTVTNNHNHTGRRPT